jgi:hypothetical protein
MVRENIARMSPIVRPVYMAMVSIAKQHEHHTDEKFVRTNLLRMFDKKVAITLLIRHNYQLFRNINLPFVESSEVSFYKHRISITPASCSKAQYAYLKSTARSLYEGTLVLSNGWEIKRVQFPKFEIEASGVVTPGGFFEKAAFMHFRSRKNQLKIDAITFFDPG